MRYSSGLFCVARRCGPRWSQRRVRRERLNGVGMRWEVFRRGRAVVRGQGAVRRRVCQLPPFRGRSHGLVHTVPSATAVTLAESKHGAMRGSRQVCRCFLCRSDRQIPQTAGSLSQCELKSEAGSSERTGANGRRSGRLRRSSEHGGANVTNGRQPETDRRVLRQRSCRGRESE